MSLISFWVPRKSLAIEFICLWTVCLWLFCYSLRLNRLYGLSSFFLSPHRHSLLNRCFYQQSIQGNLDLFCFTPPDFSTICPLLNSKHVLHLVSQLCLTLCYPMDYSRPGSSVHGDSPGKNTGVGFHALVQGIFPTQGSNPGLLHCAWLLYHLSHPGSPKPLPNC